ncbi:hypothetical protein [Neobacillus fumarioli]|uniref:hypothetical protein n=1 Tax=Neobacillus fumarioli TaxID=105229 RepID=UPI000833146C|nr:hypothetical protein [Neobacillus fumarioli]
MRKCFVFVVVLQLWLVPVAASAAGLEGSVGTFENRAASESSGLILKDRSNQSEGSIKNSLSTSLEDQYVVISNESTNETSFQSSGSFDVKKVNRKLKAGTYQVDYNKPFSAAANRGNLIRKSTVQGSVVYKIGSTRNFWVTNLLNDEDYQIPARLAYSGSKAMVWVNNNQITDEDAAKLGTEFDTKIYPEVVTNFGQESDVDHDGKINILCYDIQDGFYESGGYVAGYFGAGDLYNTPTSNKSEIIYIDTYPAMGTGPTKDVTQAYSVLAHEFQHMVNYNEKVLVEHGNPMDTWLDEGLSMASEQIYAKHGLEDRRDYYNETQAIQDGQSLLYWDTEGDTLANYTLSYLFVQYLKIQCGQGDRIFKEIIQDPNNNYKAVEDVAKKYINPNITFGKLMTDFRIALLMKNPTGLYGFKGDPFFDSIKPALFSGNTVNLRGGGAVVTTYHSINDFAVPVNKGSDITYTFIDKAKGTVLEKLLKGWVQSGGSWYYFDNVSGKTVTGWKQVNGKWYYFSTSGAMKTGWVKIEGKWYYLGPDGAMKTGWILTDGKWYYLDTSGIMRTGWLNTEGKWYYLGPDGAMKTGWVLTGGKWYYLDTSGVMKTGWIQSKGKWYYLYKDGSMARSTTINGYRLGADGSWSGA